MNRNRKGHKRRRQSIHARAYDQIRRALPYIVSIMRSLREHRLEIQRQNLTASRLVRRPGQRDRDRIIALDHALREVRQAQDRFEQALQELHTLDVECLDAIHGLALIPFAKDNDLAWFVFELFETDPLRYWRFHKDPPEMRRSIAEIHGNLN